MKKFPCALYIFQDFDEKTKKANGIRANHRLDCVFNLHECDTPDFTKKQNHPLFIYENSKRQLFLYQTPTKKVLNKRYTNNAEYCLTSSSMNLSSLFTEYEDDQTQWAYGFPNKRDMESLLKEKNYSPLADYTNDAYIFIGKYGDDKLNKQFKYLELFVFAEARDKIDTIYKLVLDGEYDNWFQECRERAYPYSFFSYKNTTTTVFDDSEV